MVEKPICSPAACQPWAKETPPAQGHEQSHPGDRRGQDHGQINERLHDPRATEAITRQEIGHRRTKEHRQAEATQRRDETEPQGLGHQWLPERVPEPCLRQHFEKDGEQWQGDKSDDAQPGKQQQHRLHVDGCCLSPGRGMVAPGSLATFSSPDAAPCLPYSIGYSLAGIKLWALQDSLAFRRQHEVDEELCGGAILHTLCQCNGIRGDLVIGVGDRNHHTSLLTFGRDVRHIHNPGVRLAELHLGHHLLDVFFL